MEDGSTQDIKDRSVASPIPPVATPTEPIQPNDSGKLTDPSLTTEQNLPKKYLIRIFSIVLSCCLVLLFLGFTIPDYTTVSNISYVLLYGGTLGAFIVGVIAARETLHRAKNPSQYVPGKEQPYTPLLIFTLTATLVFPPLIILFIVAIIISQRKKKQPIDPNPASNIRAFLLTALAFVSVAGSMALAIFVASIFLSLRACELSGSSKCF